MYRRLTQLWPDLLGQPDNADEETDQIAEEEAEVDKATDEQLVGLRDQTLSIYKNLSWTRIISLHDYNMDDQKSWPIGPDLSDEFDFMITIEEDELPEFKPLFNPVAFSMMNPQPNIGAYKLPEERMLQLAKNASALRSKISEKAKKIEKDQPDP